MFSTFGNSGIVVAKAIGSFAGPAALALLSNGDILAVAGNAVEEFGPTGSLHTSVTSTTTGATIVATSQGGPNVFQPNGDFVFGSSVAGEFGRGDADIKLVRFLPQGSVDSTFNSPVFDFGPEEGTNESARALVVQPDGHIVAGGEAGHFGAGGFGVARFNANGSFDTTFGTGGKVTTPFRNATTVETALVLQPNSNGTGVNIVAVGSELINGGGPLNFAAARYLGQ